MNNRQPSRSRISVDRVNRRLAAALVLLGLFMQAIVPYLPMPAMGGRTSWDLAGAALSGAEIAWLPTCLSPQSGEADGGPSSGAPHPGDCAACLVMQQAGSTLTPALPEMPLPVAMQRAMPALWQQTQHAAPSSDGFSSRAPPRLA